MGFFADWAAHWRFLGAEARALVRHLCKHPLTAARTLVTHPLSFSLLWFVATLYWNCVLSVVGERRWYGYEIVSGRGVDGEGPLQPVAVDPHVKLPDKGHELGYVNFFKLPDYMLYALLAATALRFLPIWPCVKPAISRMILRRWFFIEGVLFLFRGAAVSMTSVPFPWEECQSTATGNVFAEGWYYMFGIHHTCGDAMFSGHTAAVTLLLLIWTHYSRGEELAICCGPHRGCISNNVDAAGDPMGWKLIDVFLWSYGLVTFYFILATRFHYSSDVFIGFILTYFFFKYYHFYLKALAMRQGSVYARFMRWFEGIDLAQQELLKERDLEAGRMAGSGKPMLDAHGVLIGGGAGPGLGGPGDGVERAMLAGALATKDNVILGGGPGPAAATLPTSYLEGNEYYRAGVEHGSAAEQIARQQALEKSGGGSGAGVGLPLKPAAGYPLVDPKLEQAAQHFDAQERPMRILQGPAGPMLGGMEQAAGLQLPRHNVDGPMPVLAPGEHAAQERREIEREVGYAER